MYDPGRWAPPVMKGSKAIMEEKKNLLTYAGLKKLEEELHDLKVVKRKEVAGKIKEAREQGTCLRMQSTMQLKMSREILRHVLKRSRRF